MPCALQLHVVGVLLLLGVHAHECYSTYFVRVCVRVFGIIRREGGRASCQLSVDGRNIIKIIMY